MTYGMLIDLKKCIGCHACAVACKEAHGTPPKVTRAHVEIEYVGNYPDVRMTAYPMLCMHCENAPCVEVCPTGASFKREDGIVAINKYEEVMYPTMPKGTVDKCTFCADRIDAGDGRVQACVAACPAGARVFGELDDLRSQAEAAEGFQLLSEEGTNPSVWYLPKKVNA